VTQFPLVRHARTADFDAILEIRDHVAVDLLARGIRWNPNALTREHLEAWTASGNLYVGDLNGTVIGSIAVWWHDHTDFWPRADLAGYVRDLMIDPRHRGQGASLLGWAERYISGVGRNRVRLDCDASNDRLCRYYEESGYARVGTDSDGFAVFEKKLS
jgi:RimJ/RimL family protein N-acetyltransferase